MALQIAKEGTALGLVRGACKIQCEASAWFIFCWIWFTAAAALTWRKRGFFLRVLETSQEASVLANRRESRFQDRDFHLRYNWGFVSALSDAMSTQLHEVLDVRRVLLPGVG